MAAMPTQTCSFDRARAIGFRLVFAVLLLPAGARADWISRSEAIMGTRCSVELWSDERATGEAAITSVFDDMRRIDRLMSTWKEDTEISQVNREASRHPVKISQELFELLQESVRYSELTRGAFDITYASVGYLYDFKKGVHPDQKAIDAALPGFIMGPEEGIAFINTLADVDAVAVGPDGKVFYSRGLSPPPE
jgi:thiamine biosynthesis lipoprotein ApbE